MLALEPFALFLDVTFSVAKVADRSYDGLVSVSRDFFEFVKEKGSSDLVKGSDNVSFKGSVNFICSRNLFKEVYLLICTE